MSRKVLLLFVALSMAGLYGCGDDKKKDEQPQSNTTTTCDKNKCNGNISIYCVGDTPQTQDCGAAGCNQETGLCNMDTPQKCDKNYCNGNVSVYCVGDTPQTQDCGAAGCNQETGLCNATQTCQRSYCNGDTSVFCLNGEETLQGCGTAGCNQETGLCNSSHGQTNQEEGCKKNTCNGAIANLCQRDGSVYPIDCGTAGCNELSGVCNAPNVNGPAQCSKSTCSGRISNMCVNETTILMDCGDAGCNETTGLCNTQQHQECTDSVCNGSISLLCLNKVPVPVDCGVLGCDEATGKCNTHSTTEPQCERDSCSGNILNICASGTIASRDCGSDGCDPVRLMCNSSSSQVNECEESKCIGNVLNFCKNQTLFTIDCGSLGCNSDTLTCNTNAPTPHGALTYGGKVGDACDTPNYKQSCINEGRGALYCDNGTVKQLFCSSCQDAGYDTSKPLQVFCENGSIHSSDLTEGGNVGDSCSKANYKSTCINGGSNALVCWNGEVAQWDCSSCEDAGWNPEKPLEIKCEKKVPDLTEGGNIGDACSRNIYKQTCINGGANALVCWNNAVTQWDCASCDDAGYNPEKPLQVNCPKALPETCVTSAGQPGVDCCNSDTYQVSCINGNANALICSGGMVKQWDCAENVCSVSEDNRVTCPKAASSCATIGGNAGDCCDEALYQNTCINENANALVCRNGKIKKWTCADNHCEINGNDVDCPMETTTTDCVTENGTPGVDCCKASTYQVSCSNDHAHALICAQGKVKQWDCADNICSVTDNRVYCPSESSSSCASTGGNEGDCCVAGSYENTCINGNANAMVCMNGTIKKWTCADNHCVIDENVVDCPKDSGGQTCETTGGNPGDCCDEEYYQNTCINSNANALVCRNGKIKKWTCADNHCEINENEVDCPISSSTTECVTIGGIAGTDCCDVNTYHPTCINENANALICSQGRVKQWTCADSVCSVTGKQVNCPATSASCATSGGNPGECCDKNTYQPTCINSNANALICASGVIKQWNCADNQCSISGATVNCPEPQDPTCPIIGGNIGDCCQNAYYQVSCSSDNSTALICSNRKVKQLTCATNSCSIADNYVTCN